MDNPLKRLKQEVEAFRCWEKTLTGKYGEWETEYLYWDRLYDVIVDVLKNTSIDEWDTQIYDSILYTLARDNECENVLETLIEYPVQLQALSNKALSYDDFEARWQIAHGLGQIKNVGNNVRELLIKFSQDEHEYVRRRAMNGLKIKEDNF